MIRGIFIPSKYPKTCTWTHPHPLAIQYPLSCIFYILIDEHNLDTIPNSSSFESMAWLLMKLSLMPPWTCSCPTGCHWCHQGPPAVPWPLTEWVGTLQCLGSLTEWVCALNHRVPSWKGPCTHKLRSWSHHLVEDIEDPGDRLEALVDDGESLDGLEKH